MPATRVESVWPVTRTPTITPPQFGVSGTGRTTGLRNSTEAQVFFVNPNFPGAVDTRDGTEPTAPFATVAAALAACQDFRGDMIIVSPNDAWEHGPLTTTQNTAIRESVTVTVHGVKIIGAATSSTVGVGWGPAANLGTCITVHALDVLIEGFAFSGQLGALTGADGIFAEWDGVTLFGDNLTVQHCTFDAAIDTAIQLEFSWFSHVLDCYFDQCDDYGIFVDTAGSGASNLDIRDCTFFNVGTGAMTLEDTDLSVVQGNRVYNDNAEAGAAAANEGIITTGGADNMVVGNYLSCLLPGPGNGDFNDLCTGAATDAWIQNYCLNGPSTTTPT